MFPLQIFIQGLVNLNRAVHEDIVAVEILPKKEWTCPSSLVTAQLSTEHDTEDSDDDDNSDHTVCMHDICFYYR